MISHQNPIPQGISQCESGFGTRVPLHSTVTSISQLRNSLRSCCENGILLRNWRFVAKLKLTLRLPFFLFIPSFELRKGFQNQSTILAACSSSSPSHAVRASEDSAKGAKSRFCSRTFTVKGQILLRSSPCHQSRRQDDTLPGQAARPLQKKPRVESSEPIDLTEQSPEQSPSHHRFNLRYPRQILHQLQLQFPRQFHPPVPSPHPKKKSQEPQVPLPEPQIQVETPLEESEARACPIIPAAEEYHMEQLLAPRDFFYHRIATDFYQSMTTKEHWTQRREFSWKPCTNVRRILLWASSSDHGSLLYFEEKLERKRICREPFTLDKWNNMMAYKIDQPGQPQPAARRASPRRIPEGITVAAPAIPRAPPAAPAHLSHPHQLSRGWPSYI
ncbi:hypothetical protein CK203_099732 [Vitis vinifera]|uniref:Uncharacterized protein n=1 Tax=Vitis vinifera TaxID=29760 RepID=A0A438CUA1_VITVI|nr:hypothetical protein CK203_099732 [Vitis vinifera]